MKPTWLLEVKACLKAETRPGRLAAVLGISRTTAYGFVNDPDSVERTSVSQLLALLEYYHVDQNDGK